MQFPKTGSRGLSLILSLEAALGMGLWAAAAPDPGSRGVDWEAVRHKAGREEWAGAVVRGIRETVASTRREFPEPPFGRTGWAHDYYCEKDATKLRYDPAKPREHVCPKCGGKYADERRNEAWMDATYKRIHRAARLAGVLSRISADDPAADYGRRTLLWFAHNVDRFEPHGRHAGRGRIMGQSLCEATSMPDLGTSGYGIRLNRWYRSPAAHNILVVDGKVQAPRGGVLVSFATNRVEVGAREAYPSVDIRRTVTCRDGVAGDRITAASDAEHTYDLFYHFRGDLTRCSVTLAPAGIARDGSGYEWLRDVQRGSCSGRVECVIGLRDLAGRLVFQGTGAAPFEIFTGTCPDNPADRTMTFVLLRARGRNAGWTVDMKVSCEASASRLSKCETCCMHKKGSRRGFNATRIPF